MSGLDRDGKVKLDQDRLVYHEAIQYGDWRRDIEAM